MPKIQYLYKTRWVIPSIYPQKLGVILQNMNFSRYYRNRGKYIYGFDPNIIKLKTEIRHNPVIGSENNYETIKTENRCKASGMRS